MREIQRASRRHFVKDLIRGSSTVSLVAVSREALDFNNIISEVKPDGGDGIIRPTDLGISYKGSSRLEDALSKLEGSSIGSRNRRRSNQGTGNVKFDPIMGKSFRG